MHKYSLQKNFSYDLKALYYFSYQVQNYQLHNEKKIIITNITKPKTQDITEFSKKYFISSKKSKIYQE